MIQQPNWIEIKQALKDNFIKPDFQPYDATTFAGVDFDKGLEIFRYILEQKLPNHDETTSVFDKLELYSKGQQDKNVLAEIVVKYEIYIKKLFDIMHNTFPAGKALAWGYNQLFDRLSIPPSNKTSPTIRNNFFETELTSGVQKPSFLATNFNTLLTDNTNFGKSLHSSYYLRNSKIHNDPSIDTRKIPDYITDCLKSYLYFTFKYYNELVLAIPPDKLIPVQTLTIRSLSSLSGGAYNPDIENEVKRDNIIQTIENKIKDFDALFIEGEEGIGKTTILHQFVAKYPNNCFAYFIDGKDSNTYSNLTILQALCNQLCFKSKGDTLENVLGNKFYEEEVLKSYFSSNLHQVVNNKNTNQTFYFIFDGLDEISQDRQNDIKEQILDKLP